MLPFLNSLISLWKYQKNKISVFSKQYFYQNTYKKIWKISWTLKTNNQQQSSATQSQNLHKPYTFYPKKSVTSVQHLIKILHMQSLSSPIKLMILIHLTNNLHPNLTNYLIKFITKIILFNKDCNQSIFNYHLILSNMQKNFPCNK